MDGLPSRHNNIQEDPADDLENLIDRTEDENGSTGCYNFFCNPAGKAHRFIALIFMCLLGFGSYFCYDNPAALEDSFKKDLNLTTTQYTVLYSVYSWPNVVLCFVGGFLVDRVFGIRLGTIIYMTLTLLGQAIFALGAMLDMYWLVILGRFVFGIGGESLAVAQNNYAVLWFKGKELNMVFGLQMSFARIGSAVNFWVMEPISTRVHEDFTGYKALGIVLFIAGTTCILSMFCALVLGFFDRRAERILRRESASSGEKVSLKDIKDFSGAFWLLSVICVTYYVAIFPFIGIGKDFFMKEFHMDKQAANRINSSVYIISAVTSPILGFIIDKTGKNLLWILTGVVITSGSHALLAFTSLNPYVGMVSLGIAYSILASSLWPLVSLMIPEYQLGTAYGVCQAVQNLGLAVISIVTGLIVDNYGYVKVEIFFICSLMLALIATVILWIEDSRKNGMLNMTPGRRITHQQTALAAEILERAKLLSVQTDDAVRTGAHYLQPTTVFHIRNRYLSRIGAPLPPSYNEKGIPYRTLR